MKKVVLTTVFLFACLKIGKVEDFKLVQTNVFTEENLFKLMTEIGIVYPEIAMAQAKIETGYFTSRIFRENKNLFGMKLPRSRNTTAVGVNRNHAVYTDWTQSVIDYKMWQDRIIHKLGTRKKYLNYLSRNYAEDGSYVKKIKKIIN